MWETIIYAFILILVTVHFCVQRKNNLGLILLIEYTIVSIFAIWTIYLKLINTYNITLFPYLFLIIIFYIFFSPFIMKKNGFEANKIRIKTNKRYKYFAVIYIICSIIMILIYTPYVVNLLQRGNWSENRNLLYAGDLIFPKTNIIGYLSMQFVSYFQLLSLIIAFVLLKDGRDTLFAILIIISVILTTFCSSIYTSSRGMLFELVLLLFSMYSFFIQTIDKSKKKYIFITILLFLILTVPYLTEVTNSRFDDANSGSNTSSIESLIEYCGQAPIVFNKGVATIDKLSFGQYTIGKFFELVGFKDTFTQANVGGTWGSGFYTFVGWLYIDWGAIGVFIIAIICSVIFYQLIIRKEYTISMLYLIFFYYNTLIKGVFVIGRSYIYMIISMFFIYFFIWIFFEKKIERPTIKSQ